MIERAWVLEQLKTFRNIIDKYIRLFSDTTGEFKGDQFYLFKPEDKDDPNVQRFESEGALLVRQFEALLIALFS